MLQRSQSGATLLTWVWIKPRYCIWWKEKIIEKTMLIMLAAPSMAKIAEVSWRTWKKVLLSKTYHTDIKTWKTCIIKLILTLCRSQLPNKGGWILGPHSCQRGQKVPSALAGVSFVQSWFNSSYYFIGPPPPPHSSQSGQKVPSEMPGVSYVQWCHRGSTAATILMSFT